MLLKRLVQQFEKHDLNYAIAGGYAVALHGAVRGTVDLDLIIPVDRESLERVERIMQFLGLVSRLPVRANELAEFRREFIEQRNLKAWSFVNPNNPVELVDLVILYDLKEFKTVLKDSVFGRLKVLALPDLIRIKKEAGRPQDLADIEALEKIKRGKI